MKRSAVYSARREQRPWYVCAACRPLLSVRACLASSLQRPSLDSNPCPHPTLVCLHSRSSPIPSTRAQSLLSGLVGPGAKVNIKLHGYDERLKKEVSSGKGTTHLLPIYEAHEVGMCDGLIDGRPWA